MEKLTSEDMKKEIEVEHKMTAHDLAFYLVNGVGAKKALLHLGVVCNNLSGSKTCFPGNLLADKSDEENMQLLLIVQYILRNWEQISKKSLKYWKEVIIPEIKAKQKTKAKLS